MDQRESAWMALFRRLSRIILFCFLVWLLPELLRTRERYLFSAAVVGVIYFMSHRIQALGGTVYQWEHKLMGVIAFLGVTMFFLSRGMAFLAFFWPLALFAGILPLLFAVIRRREKNNS